MPVIASHSNIHHFGNLEIGKPNQMAVQVPRGPNQSKSYRAWWGCQGFFQTRPFVFVDDDFDTVHDDDEIYPPEMRAIITKMRDYYGNRCIVHAHGGVDVQDGFIGGMMGNRKKIVTAGTTAAITFNATSGSPSGNNKDAPKGPGTFSAVFQIWPRLVFNGHFGTVDGIGYYVIEYFDKENCE